ncbi:protein D3-like [Anabrus simplex]|uniref:protein D3-like n=1 Tax=Anabrus simplex TaxID=316456 RepID=UPI0034DD28C6
MASSQLISLLLLIAGTGLCHADCQPANPEVRSACDYAGLVVISWSQEITVNSSNCDLMTDKNEFRDQPEVRFPGADPDAYYTLLMIDPDVPFFKDGEYWLHWVVSNIPGHDLATGNLDASTEMKCYQRPQPPEGSGAHRYQFLVFRQNQVNVELSVPDSRQHFRLDKWLQNQSQKEGLCEISAGVQFRAPF